MEGWEGCVSWWLYRKKWDPRFQGIGAASRQMQNDQKRRGSLFPELSGGGLALLALQTSRTGQFVCIRPTATGTLPCHSFHDVKGASERLWPHSSYVTQRTAICESDIERLGVRGEVDLHFPKLEVSLRGKTSTTILHLDSQAWCRGRGRDGELALTTTNSFSSCRNQT